MPSRESAQGTLSTSAASVIPPSDPPIRAEAVTDPLRCTDRATVSAPADVFEAEWSPDARTLALSKITTIPSDRTITGTEEDQRLVLFDIATGGS